VFTDKNFSKKELESKLRSLGIIANIYQSVKPKGPELQQQQQ
jgi:hypothetical protein